MATFEQQRSIQIKYDQIWINTWQNRLKLKIFIGFFDFLKIFTDDILSFEWPCSNKITQASS